MNPRSYLRRAAALAVLLCALLFGSAVPASAHAALISTDPVQDSVVQTAPQRVLLTFSEGVLLSDDSLRVLDPHGTNVAVGAPHHADGGNSGATATVALRPGLGAGTYTVAWRAVSQDSHPVAGAFTFSVGSASRTSVDLSGVAAAGGGAASTLYGIGRYLAYGGFALLVGASVFLGVCWPRGALLRPLQRLAAGGWVTLVVATLALLVLRGPYVNGKGLGQAFDLNVMRAQLETRPGAALLSRLLLLAAAAVFLAVLFGSYAKREDPAERADLAWGLGIGGTVVSVGIAATWAMAEHASVGIQHTIAMPVDVVHLLSMAVWLGGLITLLTALWAPAPAVRPVPPYAVRRFSALALTAITLLVGTGIYQAWRQMGSWRAFTDTSYGRLLFIKICLVGLLVCLAWFSRRWTQALGTSATHAATGTTAGTASGTASGTRGGTGARRAAGGASGGGARGSAAAGAAKAAVPGPARAGGTAGAAAVTADKASGAAVTADKAGDATDDAGTSGAASGVPGDAAESAGPARTGSPASPGGAATATAPGSTAQGTGPAPTGGSTGSGAGAGSGSGSGAGSGASGPTAADAADAADAKGKSSGATKGKPSRAAKAAGTGTSSRAAGGSTGAAREAQLRRQAAARTAARARKEREADPARRLLRRSVLMEAGVAAVLLAVTTILSGSQPGRAAEEQKALPSAPSASAPASEGTGTTTPTTGSDSSGQIVLSIPYDTGGPQGKGTAGVTLAPASASEPNEIHLLLTDPGNRPVDVPEVRVSFTLPAQHLGPIPVTVHRLDTGHWTASAVRLPLAGTWQMSVTVRTSDIDEVTETRNVVVSP